MITIAEATQEAVRLALPRHWCHRLAGEAGAAEARALAGRLSRTLQLVYALRGTRRDARGLEGRARALVARLGELGLAPPGGGVATQFLAATAGGASS